MPEFGGAKYTVDRAATVAVYALEKVAGRPECDCRDCRNFRLVRAQMFPPEFLALLDSLGIDPALPREVLRYVQEEKPGRHIYEGWFHFVGTLDQSSGDAPPVPFGPDFAAYVCRMHVPARGGFNTRPVVELEFQAYNVSWLLGEPEPD